MIKVVLIRLAIGGTGIYSAVFLWERLYNYCKDETFVKLIYNIGKETLAVYLMQHIVVEILLLKTVRAETLCSILEAKPPKVACKAFVWLSNLLYSLFKPSVLSLVLLTITFIMFS